HELTHAAEWDNPTVLRIYDAEANDWAQVSRQGFMTVDSLEGEETTVRGMFYSEGLAEFMSGLYVRRTLDPTCHITSIDGLPSLELPSHYVGYKPPKS